LTVPVFGAAIHVAQPTRDVVVDQGRAVFLTASPLPRSASTSDPAWQLYDELAAGKQLMPPTGWCRPRWPAQLHELGFRTIRLALPWGPSGPESYAAPEKRQNLYAALNKALTSRRARHPRCLVPGGRLFTDAKLEPGKGWGTAKNMSANCIQPEARGRTHRYIDETVARHQHRTSY
jgi:hypothetical protein